MAKIKYPYIARIDSNHTHCWWVRIGQDAKRKMPNIKKVFSDGVYGGKHKALQAAIRFRDRSLRQLRNQGYKIGSNNGRFWGKGWWYCEKYNSKGYLIRTIIAYYWDSKKKKQIRKQFGIDRHGSKHNAIAHAKAWRNLKTKGTID